MNKKNIRVRKGQAPEKLSRDDFRARFFDKFTDPAFGAEAKALKRIEIIAWDGYTHHRKAPLTHPAGFSEWRNVLRVEGNWSKRAQRRAWSPPYRRIDARWNYVRRARSSLVRSKAMSCG